MFKTLLEHKIWISQQSFNYIHTDDNVKLRMAYWPNDFQKTIGIVCLFQGRSEFIEKYAEVILELNIRGFAVTAFDWRGQGGSERLLENSSKGHVDNFALYQKDVKVFLQHVSLLQPNVPLYALAHSMGATILIKSIIAGENRFKRAVFSAPMIELLGLKWPKFVKNLSHMLNYACLGKFFIPGGGYEPISTKPFEGNLLSSDQDRYERIHQILDAMPQLCVGDPTISWASAAFQAMSDLSKPDTGKDFTVPSLIISGGADRLCSTPAAMEFSRRLHQCQGIEISNARHEIMMETDIIRSQFWLAFDAFIPNALSKF